MVRSKQLTKIIKSLPNYSYSQFVLENPIRNKVKRQNAVKRFLDSTRETSTKETSIKETSIKEISTKGTQQNQSLNSK